MLRLFQAASSLVPYIHLPIFGLTRAGHLLAPLPAVPEQKLHANSLKNPRVKSQGLYSSFDIVYGAHMLTGVREE